MENKILSVGMIVLCALLAFIAFGGRQQKASFGSTYPTQINAGDVINSSSSVTTNGQVLITTASSTGLWFRIVNASASRVFCGLGTVTSTEFQGGQLLTPVTSSTGSNVWEMWNAKGAVSCISEGTSLVTFSYTDN